MGASNEMIPGISPTNAATRALSAIATHVACPSSRACHGIAKQRKPLKGEDTRVACMYIYIECRRQSRTPISLPLPVLLFARPPILLVDHLPLHTGRKNNEGFQSDAIRQHGSPTAGPGHGYLCNAEHLRQRSTEQRSAQRGRNKSRVGVVDL